MPYLLRVELPDVPGSLGRVATAIGEAGGDIGAIEIVEKRHDGTALDDVLLEMAPGAMPDSVVSACSTLDGVTVVWISHYAPGGNLFLDLEAVERFSEDPARALEALVDVLPGTFRADWAARVHRSRGVVQRTGAAPRELDFVELERPATARRPRRRQHPLRRRPPRRQRGRRHRPPRRPRVPGLRAGPPRPPHRPRPHHQHRLSPCSFPGRPGTSELVGLCKPRQA